MRWRLKQRINRYNKKGLPDRKGAEVFFLYVLVNRSIRINKLHYIFN